MYCNNCGTVVENGDSFCTKCGGQATNEQRIMQNNSFENTSQFDIYKYEPLWDNWRIKDLIGAGSYGKVYLAYREEYGRTYYSAVKHISIPQDAFQVKELYAEGIAADEAGAQEYYKHVLNNILNEVKTNYELKGQSNVVLYEDHIIMERPAGLGYDVFIKMELLTSLSDVLKNKTLSEQEAARLGIDICTALEAMSKKRILHRDIKPANIFIDDEGSYKLGDFGIARHMEKTLSSMSIKGTYAFMAPEIQKGEKVDNRSDIYSLGLVLYRLMNANRAPFLPLPPTKVNYDDNNKAIERRFKGEAMPQPRDAGPELSSIILKACSYNKEDRWRDAAELKEALKAFLQENPAADLSGRAAIVPAAAAVNKIAADTSGSDVMPDFGTQKIYDQQKAQPDYSSEKTEAIAAISGTETIGLYNRNGENALDDAYWNSKEEQRRRQTEKSDDNYYYSSANQDGYSPWGTDNNAADGREAAKKALLKKVTLIAIPAVLVAGLALAALLGVFSPSDKTTLADSGSSQKTSGGITTSNQSQTGNNKTNSTTVSNNDKKLGANTGANNQAGTGSGTGINNGTGTSNQTGAYNGNNSNQSGAYYGNNNSSQTGGGSGTKPNSNTGTGGQTGYNNNTPSGNNTEYEEDADYGEDEEQYVALNLDYDTAARYAQYIATSGFHDVILQEDGTVLAVGRTNEGQCDVNDWYAITAVAAGDNHSVGLKEDGTVVATGINDYGQCDVEGWDDIIAVAAGCYNTVGLKADGTVVAAGWNNCGQCNVETWQDITAVAVGQSHIIGLKADGTVVAAGNSGFGQCDVDGWQDIVAISTGDEHTVGLSSDGTVVATGVNTDGACSVTDWYDIVAVSAGYHYTIGITADGETVAVGANTWEECEVGAWSDIIAVSAGNGGTLGLMSNGKVVKVGRAFYGTDYDSLWSIAY